MYKIGLSSCDKVLCGELFRSYAEAGIDAMELSMSAPMWEEVDLPQVAGWAKEYGVNLWSIHLPFGYGAGDPLDICDPKFRERTISKHSDLIKRGAELGIGKFVVHASLEHGEGEIRTQLMPYAKDSLFSLASVADECGVTVAVEALPRTCLGRTSSEMLELISAHPSLRVCFDTNHIQLESDADFIRRVGDKIVTLHVSDFDYVRERHWLPGEGWVHWRGVLNALKEIGYSGVWMYEVDFKAPWTIIRPRDLEPTDFVRNARELFSGCLPTVIGTVNPELYK